MSARSSTPQKRLTAASSPADVSVPRAGSVTRLRAPGSRVGAPPLPHSASAGAGGLPTPGAGGAGAELSHIPVLDRRRMGHAASSSPLPVAPPAAVDAEGRGSAGGASGASGGGAGAAGAGSGAADRDAAVGSPPGLLGPLGLGVDVGGGDDDMAFTRVSGDVLSPVGSVSGGPEAPAISGNVKVTALTLLAPAPPPLSRAWSETLPVCARTWRLWQVVCRFRPLNERERKESSDRVCVALDGNGVSVFSAGVCPAARAGRPSAAAT
jgi:hypothetical protein